MDREIVVLADLDQASREAAERLVKIARDAIAARGQFTLALSGGSTPQAVYELLAGDEYRSQIDWDHAHVFWGDERCVPPDHPESNFFMAQETLLAHVPIPPSNIHRIPADQGDPEAAAVAYEQVLNACFQLQDGAAPAFDLVFLGLGTDGHTAALFPHSGALHETRRLVTTAMGERPRLPRVTLTLPVLNHAKRLIWLVAGQEKAAVVRAILEGPTQLGDFPARQVRPTHTTPLWLLDDAAARLLQERNNDTGAHDSGR